MLIFTTEELRAGCETQDKGAVCQGVLIFEASPRYIAYGALRIHDVKSFTGWSGLCGVSRKKSCFDFYFIPHKYERGSVRV